MAKRKYEVFILGQPYTLVSDGEDKVKKVAELVDRKMREAIDQGHAQNPEKAAVLAALNIAEDLLRSKSDLASMENDVEARASAILETLAND